MIPLVTGILLCAAYVGGLLSVGCALTLTLLEGLVSVRRESRREKGRRYRAILREAANT